MSQTITFPQDFFIARQAPPSTSTFPGAFAIEPRPLSTLLAKIGGAWQPIVLKLKFNGAWIDPAA